jgi:hypothetical protein
MEHYYQVTVQQHYMVLETIFNISANQKASLALVAMFKLQDSRLVKNIKKLFFC